MLSSRRNVTDYEHVEVFRKLLAEFSAFRSSTSANVPTTAPVPMSHQAEEFREFLDGFTVAYSAASTAEAEAEKVEAEEAKHDRPIFESFLADYHESIKRWSTAQKDKADEFNLMSVMGLTDKENVHSDILAWLLDHDMTERGTHAQGNLGFRLFLEAVGLPCIFADCEYLVTRESASDESRIDIEVAQCGQFVIYIENKIWADEGEDQTKREWNDLKRRAEQLACPKYAFFLTPLGTKPKCKEFRAISWRKMADVFEKFAEDIKARTTAEGALAVSLFATHYAGILRRHIVHKSTEREESDADQSI